MGRIHSPVITKESLRKALMRLIKEDSVIEFLHAEITGSAS